jgi:hypothetical protein
VNGAQRRAATEEHQRPSPRSTNVRPMDERVAARSSSKRIKSPLETPLLFIDG